MSIISSLVSKAVGVIGPQKYLWAALGVLGITVVSEGWVIKGQLERAGAQTLALKDAQASIAALRLRQTQDAKAIVATKAAKRVAARKAAVRAQAISVAVANSPQWRDQPIPQEVIDAILQRNVAGGRGSQSDGSAQPVAGSDPHVDYGVHYSPDSVRGESQGTDGVPAGL